jgi:uncharacterized protein YrrD
MSKIRIGSPIFSSDGQETGEVDRVVIDPKSGQLTHVVARATGQLLRDIVLPVDAVREWSDDAVFLKLGVLDLDRMPDYTEEDYVQPAEEELPAGPYRHSEVLFSVAHVRRAAPDDLPLGKEVECQNGLCGVVDEVLVDPVRGQVLSFRLRRGGALTRDVVVPVEWVHDARGKRVRLDCTVRQLEDLLPQASVPEKAAWS